MKSTTRNRTPGVIFAACVFLPGQCCAWAQEPAASQAGKPKFDSVKIDSLDPDGWNGVVFAAKAFHQPANFALRFGSFSQSFIDGAAISDAVREVGPHTPDASYCKVSWQNYPRAALITLEWSRVDKTTVVGRVTAAAAFQIVLETYIPFAASTWGLTAPEVRRSTPEAWTAWRATPSMGTCLPDSCIRPALITRASCNWE
jgi:hypothetical protein